MKAILVITGDGGECYETLYAVHRFREAGYEPRIAAPSRKVLHLVMHDFEPGWDTYIERPGYQLPADLDFTEVRVEDYAAVSCPGAVRQSICETTGVCSPSFANSANAANGFLPFATACKCWQVPDWSPALGSRRTRIVASMSK